ncbi:myb/SANT-like domain-containing protein [Artemisia annua]|uniref:Myb/SANT-like domain-containing protein n=1 Tax=Artemisia annua TaxID=35608 RepID=A0A2U1NJT4_ARTAN|nr:myb/SANT-like domain-containing protein [Artemisia annua]
MVNDGDSEAISSMGKNERKIYDRSHIHEVFDEMPNNEKPKQEGSVTEYYNTFTTYLDALICSTRNLGFGEWCLVSLFMAGLQPEIKEPLRIFSKKGNSDGAAMDVNPVEEFCTENANGEETECVKSKVLDELCEERVEGKANRHIKSGAIAATPPALSGMEGLKVLSWKRVAKVLKDNHNFEVDQKQMKNHYDYLKTKCTTWLSLRNKTGNIYDESTNTFILLEEDWKLEILKNKNAKSLKTTSLPFPELCAPLFDGTLSTGFKSARPSSKEPRRVVEAHVVVDDEEIEVVNVDSPTPLCSSRDPRPPVKTNKIGKQLLDGIEEEILGVLKVIANKINQPTSESPPKPEPPSVEDCENKLNGLEWDENTRCTKPHLQYFVTQMIIIGNVG